MLIFLKKPSQKSTDSISIHFHRNITRYDQSMSNQHICPCCSYRLLRHIDSGGLYWHCSHCHQEMPAYN